MGKKYTNVSTGRFYKKFTFDMPPEQFDIFNKYQKEFGSNKLGPSFLGLIDDYDFITNPLVELRDCICSFCFSRLRQIDDELSVIPKPLYRQKLINEKNYYTHYLELIHEITLDVRFNDRFLINIELNTGTLKIPSDWVVVNPDDAANCEYAFVLESRYEEKDFPYFVILVSSSAPDVMTKIDPEILNTDLLKDVILLLKKKIKKYYSKELDLEKVFNIYSIPSFSAKKIDKSVPFGAMIIKSS